MQLQRNVVLWHQLPCFRYDAPDVTNASAHHEIALPKFKSNQNMNTFGARLKIERNRLGMTQPEMAAIGDVQKNAQITYEKDTSSPTAAYLARIGDAGVDIHFLFYGVYSDTAASQQFNDLLSVLHKLPPEHQAIAFGMLSMISMLAGNASETPPNMQRADQYWRAARLFTQFCALDEKEKQMVEAAAEIMQMRKP